MTLTFTVRHEFGRDRYYATDTASRTLVHLTGRKCLRDVDIERLKLAGFELTINYETKQWGATNAAGE